MTQQKDSHLKAQNRALTRKWISLDLMLPASRTVGGKFLLSYPVYGLFVKASRVHWDTPQIWPCEAELITPFFRCNRRGPEKLKVPHTFTKAVIHTLLFHCIGLHGPEHGWPPNSKPHTPTPSLPKDAPPPASTCKEPGKEDGSISTHRLWHESCAGF